VVNKKNEIASLTLFARNDRINDFFSNLKIISCCTEDFIIKNLCVLCGLFLTIPRFQKGDANMKRENLRFTPSARLIWTGVIIFLLFTSISSYIFKEQERKLRIFTQDKLISTLEETYLLQSRLFDVNNAIRRLEIDLDSKKQQIEIISAELQQERDLRNDVEVRLAAAIKEKNSVDLDKIIVHKTGKISRTRRNNSFSTDLGTTDGIKKGDILSVYRDDKFIGNAEVSKTKRTSATASILSDWRGVEFKKGDEVRIER